MNVQTVIDNLNNTIAGKEGLLARTKKYLKTASFTEEMALYATKEFLEINIEELKRIRDDLIEATK